MSEGKFIADQLMLLHQIFLYYILCSPYSGPPIWTNLSLNIGMSLWNFCGCSLYVVYSWFCILGQNFFETLFVTVTDISRPCQPDKLIPLLPWPGFDPSFSGHNDRRAITASGHDYALDHSDRGWQQLVYLACWLYNCAGSVSRLYMHGYCIIQRQLR